MAVNDDHDARETTRFDERIGELYRRVSTQEPCRDLDDRIHALAHAAHDPRVPVWRARWRMRWRLPFAVAAVALVSVSIVMLMSEQGAERVAVQAPMSTNVPSAPSAPSRVQDERVAAGEAPNGSAPRADESQRSKARLRSESRSESEPRSESTPPRVRAQDTTAGEPTARPSAAASDTASNETEVAPGAGRSEAFSAKQQAPPGTSRAAPAPMAAAPYARRSTLTGASDVTQLIADLDAQPPAAWLERIVTLRRHGQTEEADALLKEFRRRFPNEAVPTSVQ